MFPSIQNKSYPTNNLTKTNEVTKLLFSIKRSLNIKNIITPKGYQTRPYKQTKTMKLREIKPKQNRSSCVESMDIETDKIIANLKESIYIYILPSIDRLFYCITAHQLWLEPRVALG